MDNKRFEVDNLTAEQHQAIIRFCESPCAERILDFMEARGMFWEFRQVLMG